MSNLVVWLQSVRVLYALIEGNPRNWENRVPAPCGVGVADPWKYATLQHVLSYRIRSF